MKVIVSIALIKARETISRYTVESILDQTCPPDKLFINLSSEPYMLDEGFDEEPYWIKKVNSSRIQLNWVKNTGPYRKLLPTLEHIDSDDLLVTADDDVIYSRNWLERLISKAKEFPNEIVCGRARRPKFNSFGKIQSYKNWPVVIHNQIGMELLPTGISGVVYRKHNLDLNFLYSEEYKEISPTNDDPWFREASKRKSVSVRVLEGVDNQCFPVSGKVNLCNENTQNNRAIKLPFTLRVLRRLRDEIKAYAGVQTVLNDKYIKEIENLSKKLKYRPLSERTRVDT